MRSRSPVLPALLLVVGVPVLTGCGAAPGTATGAATGTATGTATGAATGAGSGPSPAPGPSADRALPTSYRFVLTASCGERSLHGDYRLTVRDGMVTAAEPVAGTAAAGLALGDYPTLADLLAKARDAGPKAHVHLVRDDAGIPVELNIDHLPDAIDDEECYDVSDLEVLRAG